MMDKIEMGVVLQLMELIDDGMKNHRCRFVSFCEVDIVIADADAEGWNS